MNTKSSSDRGVTSERWRRAQRYEAGHWEEIARRIGEKERGQLHWYEWRADRLRSLLTSLGLEDLTDGSARVLEVGSGPVGVATYFPGRRRVAIDPLEEFYAENSHLTELRDPEVRYDQGVGEDLPYEDDAFDLLIVENCIDHVSDVGAVMDEISRVLEPEGILYLTVNCRTLWGYWIHRLLARLRIDPGHPHTFTRKGIHELVEGDGFRVLHSEAVTFREAWWEYLTTGDLTDRAQALLGVNHFTVTLVARGRSTGKAGT